MKKFVITFLVGLLLAAGFETFFCGTAGEEQAAVEAYRGTPSVENHPEEIDPSSEPEEEPWEPQSAHLLSAGDRAGDPFFCKVGGDLIRQDA